MSTSATLQRWSDVPAEPLNPLLTRRFVSGEQSTIATIELKAGCIVPTHSHPNEQISTVVSGLMKFTFSPEGAAAQEIIVRPGEVLLIPSQLPHAAQALQDTVNIDFFSPSRLDWSNGDDAYLRSEQK